MVDTGIGNDIKETLIEVGASYTILRESGNLTGDYIDYENNSQVTKPFIREYFLEATMAYDTLAVPGDVLTIDPIDQQFIVMNSSSEQFENSIISKGIVLYKCNVSGELLRFSGEGRDSLYRPITKWNTVKSNAYGLLTETLFGTTLTQDDELGQLGIESDDLYLPHSYGAKINDRYEYVSGEFLKIETVEKRKFDSVDVCHLAEDTRE